MVFNGTLTRIAACCAMALAANAADAAQYQFTVTGDYSASWQMNSTVVPDISEEGGGFVMWDVTGDFSGAVDTIADLTFYHADIGGGMQIYDYMGDNTLLLTDGPQLYSGSEDQPTFLLGTFAMTEFGGSGQYTLTVSEVSAVPEPATYAMLLGGLGLVGTLAARRRKS
ncbi:PEP-CTERM sorting domain-containing protein [Paucibacter sp. R3-3]|uniref:PEP-CTERM sorting domain-containing protein n=1 Tax=Roseateles agri TaxID=3098619 RepID=A0ABU5DM30_9BURK|nr:PEP-CTERM sorting domain-containing protein [Paucibacter sp. R3-3]MDY0746157.1 PEP-CTERM sorting domain-containing protein [Paucibacter sp. R3-3]